MKQQWKLWCILGIFSLFVLYLYYLHCIHSSPTISCISNLREIDGAKGSWGLEFHAKMSDVPSWYDLQLVHRRFLNEIPKCPDGGTYTIGALRDCPKCSHGGLGHDLEWGTLYFIDDNSNEINNIEIRITNSAGVFFVTTPGNMVRVPYSYTTNLNVYSFYKVGFKPRIIELNPIWPKTIILQTE